MSAVDDMIRRATINKLDNALMTLPEVARDFYFEGNVREAKRLADAIQKITLVRESLRKEMGL